MKRLVLACSILAPTFAFADCQVAAIAAATTAALESGSVYQCGSTPLNLSVDENVYAFELECKSDVGTEDIAFQVSFADMTNCTDPTVTGTPQ